MKTTILFAFLSLALCCASPVYGAVIFDWATVGNAGNAGDVQSQGTFGAVAYSYRISKTEVTNSQYTDFLNAVAASDPNGLYNTIMGSTTWGGITRSGSPGSYIYAVKADAVGQGPGGSDYTYANKPVGSISFFDAMRFVNWLQNGQPSGAQDASTTEEGVYTINDGLSETRTAGATFFLPSEDEWYKAAYHKNDGVSGNFWDFPSSTDVTPNNNLPSGDTGNSANFFDVAYTTGDSFYPATNVGAYTLSESDYGTFDQGGNGWEWNEAVISSTERGISGGHWGTDSSFLAASSRESRDPTFGNVTVGFRVASIPEPSSLLLAAISGLFLFGRRGRNVS